jgi:hypothetical protein
MAPAFHPAACTRHSAKAGKAPEPTCAECQRAERETAAREERAERPTEPDLFHASPEADTWRPPAPARVPAVSGTFEAVPVAVARVRLHKRYA